MSPTNQRSTSGKIQLFQSVFRGQKQVYGTYDPETGKHWQVKEPVDDQVVFRHLKGVRPFGLYPLVGNRTRIAAIDLDQPDQDSVRRLLVVIESIGMECLLERSKSKGYHFWFVLEEEGISAGKIRAVLTAILNRASFPGVEVFPKQDELEKGGGYGNFFNTPLFGGLVPEGRTVLLDSSGDLSPVTDPWPLLERIGRIDESTLDHILRALQIEHNPRLKGSSSRSERNTTSLAFGLPVCIRRLLVKGVNRNQRSTCFRIAVHLKRVGLPEDLTFATLLQWRTKNRPQADKQIITIREVQEQVGWVYRKSYTGYGCNEETVREYCHPSCPVFKSSGGGRKDTNTPG